MGTGRATEETDYWTVTVVSSDHAIISLRFRNMLLWCDAEPVVAS